MITELNETNKGAVIELLQEYRTFYDYPVQTEDIQAFLTQLQHHQAHQMFVFELEGTPLGFVNLYPCYSTLALQKLYILNDLYVSEQGRGKGVAKSLILHALEFARQRQAIRIELKTDRMNENARGLYRAMGFEEDANNVYYRVPV